MSNGHMVEISELTRFTLERLTMMTGLSAGRVIDDALIAYEVELHAIDDGMHASSEQEANGDR